MNWTEIILGILGGGGVVAAGMKAYFDSHVAVQIKKMETANAEKTQEIEQKQTEMKQAWDRMSFLLNFMEKDIEKVKTAERICQQGREFDSRKINKFIVISRRMATDAKDIAELDALEKEEFVARVREGDSKQDFTIGEADAADK